MLINDNYIIIDILKEEKFYLNWISGKWGIIS